jgi:glutathione peroxidase
MSISSFFLFNFIFSPAPIDTIPRTIYEFKVQSLLADTIDFSRFKGKKILIVNTASKCGFTPQYKELETLSNQFKEQLVVVGFPSNNFLFQEPKAGKEIAEFCQRNYGVTFPMAEKISVRGKHKAPIYHWLTNKKYNGYQNSRVKWNFQKYLIDENGKLIAIFNPKVSPLSDEILNAIQQK